MQALATAVQDRLTDLINEPAPSREQQTRRDAWTLYQTQRHKWLEGTLKQWQAALSPSATAPKKADSDGFELVGAEVADNRIAALRTVQGLIDKVGPELDDLLLRIKFLVGSQASEAPEILQPDVLLQLMVEQWALTGLPLEAWTMVGDVVLSLLSDRLKKAYVSANESLIKRGVLRTIELKDRVRFIPSAPSRGVAPRGNSAAQAPLGRQSGRESDDTEGAADTGGPQRSASQTGRSQGSSGRQSRGDDHDSDQARMSTEGSPLSRARSRAQGVLGQLKRMLVGSVGANFEATQYHPPSPALAAAMAERPNAGNAYLNSVGSTADASPAGMAKVVGELRRRTSDLKNKAETKSEKATIEIVALMFQAILQEDRIPPGMRVWFARLQMPVLRLALTDADFFGDLTHPARQLIDRMGSCAMGFDASGINGNALESEIKRVVQVVEQYPETGKRVYQLVLDEFQKFLAQFLTQSESTKKLVSVAQLVEEKETLTIQYTIEMRNLLNDMPVREDVREFLFKVWAEVLAVAAVRKGPQDPETLGYKSLASELVWAASAKPSRADRSRVIKELPQLLQKLRGGMTLLGLAPSEQDTHIKTVSDTLADAFLSKTQSISSEQIAMMAERLANLEDFMTDEGMGDLPLDGESIELMLGLDASMIDVVTDGGSKPTEAMVVWAQELQLGSWFTLDHNGRVAQAQFVWRSDRKHLNLFASTDGRSYLIQAGRLAAYLQAGLLLPQEEDALTVRATRDALSKLEANPERLLS